MLDPDKARNDPARVAATRWLDLEGDRCNAWEPAQVEAASPKQLAYLAALADDVATHGGTVPEEWTGTGQALLSRWQASQAIEALRLVRDARGAE